MKNQWRVFTYQWQVWSQNWLGSMYKFSLTYLTYMYLYTENMDAIFSTEIRQSVKSFLLGMISLLMSRNLGLSTVVRICWNIWWSIECNKIVIKWSILNSWYLIVFRWSVGRRMTQDLHWLYSYTPVRAYVLCPT